MIEKTLAIIKPDAVQAGHTKAIVDRIKAEGFTILSSQDMHLTKDQAEQFYAVHKERPFYGELVEFMCSGPVTVLALQKENAIKAWRDLMGDTNPAKAADGTIRKLYGTDIGNNATHGSDAPETAQVELTFFFPDLV